MKRNREKNSILLLLVNLEYTKKKYDYEKRSTILVHIKRLFISSSKAWQRMVRSIICEQSWHILDLFFTVWISDWSLASLSSCGMDRMNFFAYARATSSFTFIKATFKGSASIQKRRKEDKKTRKSTCLYYLFIC